MLPGCGRSSLKATHSSLNQPMDSSAPLLNHCAESQHPSHSRSKPDSIDFLSRMAWTCILRGGHCTAVSPSTAGCSALLECPGGARRNASPGPAHPMYDVIFLWWAASELRWLTFCIEHGGVIHGLCCSVATEQTFVSWGFEVARCFSWPYYSLFTSR
jgi:hypothetical protein